MQTASLKFVYALSYWKSTLHFVAGMSAVHKHKVWGMRRHMLALAASILLPTIFLTVLLTTFTVYRTTLDNQREISLRGIEKESRNIEELYTRTRNAVRSLAQQPAVMEAAATGYPAYAGATETVRERLALRNVETLFLLLVEQGGIYDQLRCLDASGYECVRVDLQDGESIVLPLDELQDKSHRYYFKDVLRYPAGTTYSSKIDLNREFGEIEYPLTPVMRIAEAIRNKSGQFVGAIIANLQVKKMFRVEELAESSGYPDDFWFITDRRGYYYHHGTDPEREWGDPENLNTGHSLESDFPDAYRKIISGSSGRVTWNGQSWRFFSQQITPISGFNDHTLVIGHMIPEKYLMAGTLAAAGIATSIPLFLLLLFSLVIAGFSSRIIKPISRLSENMARYRRGEWEARAEAAGPFEIQQLADNFNRMANELSVQHRHMDALVESRTAEAESALRKTEQTLLELKSSQERNKQLSKAVEQSPVTIIITNASGTITYVNPAFSRISGYSFEEAIGNNPSMVSSGLQPPAFYKEMWQTIQSGERWSGELANRRKNGELYWDQAVISPIRNEDGEITHYVAMQEDVTQQRRQAEQIANMAQLSKLNPGPVLRISLEGQLLLANPPACAILGLPENTVDDLPVACPLPAQRCFTRFNSEKTPQPAFQFEYQWEHRTILFKVRRSDQFKEYNLYGADITPLKEAEKVLKNATEAARAANKAKSDFLASMSHELRTPLNAIIGFSQVLQQGYFGDLTDKQGQYVQDILESGEHLLSLITDILDISKIEAGKMELQLSSFAAEEVLQSSFVMIKDRCTKHGIKLEPRFDASVKDLTLNADERKFKQILFNLLSNAAKFTPDGGSITMEACASETQLDISVRDTGIGIPKEQQEKIFEEFQQLETSLHNRPAGTGLGLSLTRKLVELHGGELRVQSDGPGTGSTFTFNIPFQLPTTSKVEFAAYTKHRYPRKPQ